MLAPGAERLVGARAEGIEQFQDVRAAGGPAVALLDPAHPAGADPQPYEAGKTAGGVRTDGIGARQRLRFGGEDRQALVQREPHAHPVHRDAGLDPPAPVVPESVGLRIDEFGFEVPEAVLAQEALAADLAAVDMAAGRGRRERHGQAFPSLDYRATG